MCAGLSRRMRGAMSDFSASKAVEDVHRREEHAKTGLLVPVLAAILAVFAAIASLIAHHSSTSALAVKNEAILSENKSSSQYAYYESKRIKYHLYTGLLMANPPRDPAVAKQMSQIATKENADAQKILKTAQHFGDESEAYSSQSEGHMVVYETEEVAATLFEVSIVLVSLSALMRTPLFIYGGALLSLGGFFYLIKGLTGH